METEDQNPSIRYRLKRIESTPPLFSDYETKETTATSPCEWFSKKFPKQAELYGPPVLEATYLEVDQAEHIKPAALNEEFFGGVLSGDEELNHHVIYFPQENVFYFFDCWFGYYAPTTEDKIKTWLSQLLIQCAAEMPGTVDVKPLFCELRSDESLKKIIKQAKSMLSVCPSFFSGSNGKKRLCGDEVVDPTAEPSYKLFVKDSLIPQPNEVLTLGSAYANFSEYCVSRGLVPVERRHFRSLIAEVIKDEYGVSYRKDLKDQYGKWERGWKGIKVNDLVARKD